MADRKKAGHLRGAVIVEFSDCVVVKGRLDQDLRETHHTGEHRDFSGSSIRTSWLERLEYVEHCDTTVIYTRNSIYFAKGNIIEPALGDGVFHAEGKQNIRDMMFAHTKTLKPDVEVDAKYVLNESGSAMTGHPKGSSIVYVPKYLYHPLCDRDEVPFRLVEHSTTPDIQDVFFLNKSMFHGKEAK